MVELALLGASSFGLGALHAFEPGHGKAVVAAYLIGSRGKTWHAVVLGLVVTVTHTFIVFVLAVLSLAAAEYGGGKQVERFLPLVSGLLVLSVGAWLVWLRFARLRRHHEHTHEHDHDHDHDQGHSHVPLQPRALTPAALVALGVSAGLVPCHGALAVLLSALALGRMAQGLVLLVLFSVGLASVLVAVGIAMVKAAGWAGQRLEPGKWGRIAALGSACLITLVGLGLTARAIVGLM